MGIEYKVANQFASTEALPRKHPVSYARSCSDGSFRKRGDGSYRDREQIGNSPRVIRPSIAICVVGFCAAGICKIQVFDLCRWRNQNLPCGAAGPAGEVIPPRIIDKPPSAELRRL